MIKGRYSSKYIFFAVMWCDKKHVNALLLSKIDNNSIIHVTDHVFLKSLQYMFSNLIFLTQLNLLEK